MISGSPESVVSWESSSMGREGSSIRLLLLGSCSSGPSQVFSNLKA